jgi:hypothetical protein
METNGHTPLANVMDLLLDCEQLIRRADEAMYAAKRDGGNRFKMAGEASNEGPEAAARVDSVADRQCVDISFARKRRGESTSVDVYLTAPSELQTQPAAHRGISPISHR